MPKNATEDKYRAPALDKGLDILELLSNQPKGMTRGEIVKAMGRSPSEIYRMIERLVVREYLFRSIEGDRYTLSMKLYLLGTQYPPQKRMVSQAQPLMDEFADKTKQSIHLAAPNQGGLVVIAQASPPASWEFRLHMGTKLSLIGSGSGRTYLAFQTSEKRHELLANLKENQDETFEISSVEKDVMAIHKAGYRTAPSKRLLGVTDISAPVIGIDGYAIAALTCPYIERVDKVKGKNREETLEILQSVAEQLSID